MISEETFKKTEGLLYRYFKKKRYIDILQNRITILEDQISFIEMSIRSTHMYIPVQPMGIDYSQDKVDTGPPTGSYVENAMIKEIEKLQKELEFKKRSLLKNKAKIRNLDYEIADLSHILDMLSNEAKEFVKLKYGSLKKMAFEEIADKMHISKTTALRKRQEIVEDVAKLLNVTQKSGPKTDQKRTKKVASL